jgi:hypothetical protein
MRGKRGILREGIGFIGESQSLGGEARVFGKGSSISKGRI